MQRTAMTNRAHRAPALIEPLEPRIALSIAPADVALASPDESGAQCIWELVDDSWRQVRLADIPGAPDGIDEAIAWIDPDDGQTFAAGISGDGLLLFTRNEEGIWGVRNIQESIGGADWIMQGLHYLQGADGAFHLVGLSGSGHLLRYTLANGSDRWTFTDITRRDLEANGEPTPQLVGDISVYATAWGGLNVIGLDGSGRVWGTWWAPGMPHWACTDLSAATGTDVRLSGGLTTYVTSWHNVTIAGVDSSGDLRAIWWVPEFSGTWAQTNMSDEFGGGAFETGNVMSFMSAWGGLNIGGVDEASGEVFVFWWAPGMTSWGLVSLHELVGVESGDIGQVTSIDGISGRDGSLNVIATVDDEGDLALVRAHWTVESNQWQGEDISAVAIRGEELWGVEDGYGYDYSYSYDHLYEDSFDSYMQDQLLAQQIEQYFAAMYAAYATYYAGSYTGDWFDDSFWFDRGYQGEYEAPDDDDGYGYSGDVSFANSYQASSSISSGSLLSQMSYNSYFNMTDSPR